MGTPNLSGKFFPFPRSGNGQEVVVRPSGSTAVSADGLPVPPPALLQGYHAADYIDTGQRDVDAMLAALARNGAVSQELGVILEVGSGSARMLRALPRDRDLWGVDISAEHVSWCQENLGPTMRFATISTHPHLPFEDRAIDLVYAGSVFTHIAEMADAWLLEMLRVLKPGGWLWVTVHDEHTIAQLADEYTSHPHQRVFADRVGRFARRRLLGSRWNAAWFANDPQSQVFYDSAHLRRRWGAFAEVVSMTPGGYGYQTGMLLRKSVSQIEGGRTGEGSS